MNEEELSVTIIEPTYEYPFEWETFTGEVCLS